VRLGGRLVDDGGGEPADAPMREHRPADEERVDLARLPRDLECAAAHLVDVGVTHHAALVDHDDALQETVHLIDEVRGEHDGAGVRRVVEQQLVVEHGVCRRVESEVGLVEEGDRGARCEPDHDAERRQLAA